MTDRPLFAPHQVWRALRALGIGLAAVAAGAFVGYLVNGLPQRPTAPSVAAVAAATPAVETPAPTPPPTPVSRPTIVEAREPAPPAPTPATAPVTASLVPTPL